MQSSSMNSLKPCLKIPSKPVLSLAIFVPAVSVASVALCDGSKMGHPAEAVSDQCHGCYHDDISFSTGVFFRNATLRLPPRRRPLVRAEVRSAHPSATPWLGGNSSGPA